MIIIIFKYDKIMTKIKRFYFERIILRDFFELRSEVK
tara:strand:+ start:455 stop:565 length:111 start_codon:yes stop_codon:yes gene_type:complete